MSNIVKSIKIYVYIPTKPVEEIVNVNSYELDKEGFLSVFCKPNSGYADIFVYNPNFYSHFNVEQELEE